MPFEYFSLRALRPRRRNFLILFPFARSHRRPAETQQQAGNSDSMASLIPKYSRSPKENNDANNANHDIF